MARVESCNRSPAVQPAIVRAQARAFALSVTPGNRRRSSMAADNFALLIEDGADRGGLGDDEHLSSLGRRTTAGKHDMRRDRPPPITSSWAAHSSTTRRASRLPAFEPSTPIAAALRPAQPLSRPTSAGCRTITTGLTVYYTPEARRSVMTCLTARLNQYRISQDDRAASRLLPVLIHIIPYPS